MRLNSLIVHSLRNLKVKTNTNYCGAGEKQFEALQFLNLSNKTTKLKHLKVVFPQNQLNNLIIDRLKELQKCRVRKKVK